MNEPRRKTVHIITSIGIILICIAGILPGLLATVVPVNWNHKLETLGFVAASVTTLIVVNLVYSLVASHSEQVLASLADLEQSRRVRTLSSHDMYAELLRYMQGAKDRFYTCYFGDHPPNNSPKIKRTYHNSVIPTTKKNSDLIFRRIVLLTDENLPWILALADKCTNVSNASLSVYCSEDGTSLPLSVQLVDQEVAVLVHPSRKSPGAARDIVLLDRTAVHLLDGYYERIWQASRPVITQGKVVDGALDELSGLARRRVAGGVFDEE